MELNQGQNESFELSVRFFVSLGRSPGVDLSINIFINNLPTLQIHNKDSGMF